MTPEAAAYLTKAIEYIQRHALRSNRVNWQEVSAEALVRIQDAQTTADTYPTLRWVLAQLGDRHSSLLSSQSHMKQQEGVVHSSGLAAVYPEGVITRVDEHSPAAHAGLHIRDIIEAINGTPRAQFDRVSFRRALFTSPVSLMYRQSGQEVHSDVTLHAASYTRELWPHGWQLEPDIGYLELPSMTGNHAMTKAYAQAGQRLIGDMDQAGIRRWVIDLRRNGGGNMWPMLAGVASLLGEGECGFFVSPIGKQQSWLPILEKQTNALLDNPYTLTEPAAALAILTSPLTGSSGEFTTLAFTGRPHTRSFGEPTAGLPTANVSKPLSDGAWLSLTVSYGADRTGRVYEDPIMPDEPVRIDWTLFQTEHDPVVLAAVAWLRSQGSA